MALPTNVSIWTHTAVEAVKSWVYYASEHTGIPVLVVAAIGVVVSYRVVKKVMRLVLEVAIVSAVLFGLTQFHVITW